MEKRGLFILAGLFLVIILLNGVSAEKCSIVQKSSCASTNMVLGISDLSNAHIQDSKVRTDYNYVLCCDFSGGSNLNSCSSDPSKPNIVLRGYSGSSLGTNMHAEIPDKAINFYGYNLCYGDLVCVSSVSGNPNSVDYNIEMDLSLSSDSNAHVGGKDVYPYKIYCGHRSGYCGDGRVDAGEECDKGVLNGQSGSDCTLECKDEDIRDVYWTNEAGNGVIIQATKVVGQEADVYMFLSSTPGESMQGKTITYEIYQKRVGGGNQPIRVGSNAISEVATSSSGSKVYWNITNSDITNFIEDYSTYAGTYRDIWFMAKDESGSVLGASGNLKLIVEDGGQYDGCTYYNTINYQSIDNAKVACEADTSQDSTQEEETGLCKYEIANGCKWDDEKDLCEFGRLSYVANENNPSECTPPDLSCTYTETKRGDCNSGASSFVIEYTRTNSECPDVADRTVYCANVSMLPFFNYVNFIISILAIAGIYFVMSRRK